MTLDRLGRVGVGVVAAMAPTAEVGGDEALIATGKPYVIEPQWSRPLGSGPLGSVGTW